MNVGNNLSNFEYAARFGVGALKTRDPKNATLSTAELFDEPEEEYEDLLAELEKSMKNFEDVILTGLDEDDRKKMNDELQDYLAGQGLADKEFGELTAEELKDLNSFIKNLLEKYAPNKKAEDFGDFFLGKNDNALKYKYSEAERKEEEKFTFAIF